MVFIVIVIVIVQLLNNLISVHHPLSTTQLDMSQQQSISKYFTTSKKPRIEESSTSTKPSTKTNTKSGAKTSKKTSTKTSTSGLKFGSGSVVRSDEVFIIDDSDSNQEPIDVDVDVDGNKRRKGQGEAEGEGEGEVEVTKKLFEGLSDDIDVDRHKRFSRLIRRTDASSNTNTSTNTATSKATGSAPTKYTPLEQQVLALRASHPDCLLMVEVGYRIRFFGNDALAASKVLSIYAHQDHNFMVASIPTFRILVHCRRLVAAGLKVAIVRQTETAAIRKATKQSSSSGFERAVVAVFTQGTLLDDDDPAFQDLIRTKKSSERTTKGDGDGDDEDGEDDEELGESDLQGAAEGEGIDDPMEGEWLAAIYEITVTTGKGKGKGNSDEGLLTSHSQPMCSILAVNVQVRVGNSRALFPYYVRILFSYTSQYFYFPPLGLFLLCCMAPA